MGFNLAFLICTIGSLGLFYLDRDKATAVSKALWLPVIWFWIIGSRPVSLWIGIWLGIDALGTAGKGVDAQLDGSPIDALVFVILLAIGIAVLYRRGSRVNGWLWRSLPVLIYFAYCLLSLCWSPITAVAFKRWVKDVGDLVMILVIVTDPRPAVALRALFARVGFILFPASILLIRYSDIGRGFDPEGNPWNTGVTTNKNTLGLITYMIAIGAVWSFLYVWRQNRSVVRNRQLIARGALVAFSVAVLYMAHSATAVACFALGTLLIFITELKWTRRRPGRVHAVVLTLVFASGAGILMGGEGTVAHILGRNSTLTGRTDIWKAVIPLCPDPWVGAGFESFWNTYGDDVEGLSKYESHNLNSAHNGYIDVYLNLGWIGVCLVGLIILTGYPRACAAFRRMPEIGGLLLAYLATSATYSVSEAGFRVLTPSWMALLLAVVGSGGIASGLVGVRVPKSIQASATQWGLWPPAKDSTGNPVERGA